jgi:hypothetical protein
MKSTPRKVGRWRCPHCGGTKSYHSRRQGLEFLLLPLLRPYRCDVCWNRFLRPVLLDLLFPPARSA